MQVMFDPHDPADCERVLAMLQGAHAASAPEEAPAAPKASKPRKPSKPTPAPEEPAPDDGAGDPTPPVTTVTQKTVIAKLGELIEATDRDTARRALNEFGAKGVGSLKVGDYAAFVAHVDELLALTGPAPAP